eukprot:8541542-Heterocapsa_arctica.AAC.1
MIPLPHFSIETRPPVSRNGGVAPEQGWTAEKERRLGAPGQSTVRRLVSSYRGHSLVQHGYIKACLACGYVETTRSVDTALGSYCLESGALPNLILTAV